MCVHATMDDELELELELLVHEVTAYNLLKHSTNQKYTALGEKCYLADYYKYNQ